MFESCKKQTGNKVVEMPNAHNFHTPSENQPASSNRRYIVGAVVFDDDIWIGEYIWNNSTNKQAKTDFRKDLDDTDHEGYHFEDGATVVYDGGIHLLGTSYSDEEKYHRVYDGTSSGFGVSTTLPQLYKYSPAVVLDNKIHIFGGETNPTYHYTWQTGASSWTLLATETPVNMKYGLAVVRQSTNHIHIFKGTSHYELSNGSWVSKGTSPFNVTGTGYAIVSKGSSIHVFYGYNHYIWNGSTWTTVQDIPFPVDKYTFAVLHGDEIVLVGGRDSSRLAFSLLNY